MKPPTRETFLSAGVLIGLFVFSAALTVPLVEKFPICFFHYFTKLDCPGCGLVRSFISISHGRFLEAVRFNALGPLVYLLFFLLLLKLIFQGVGRSFPSPFALQGRWIYWLFAFLFWGQWILKLAKGLHQHYLPILS